jgi:hypothetical protein
LHGRIVFAVTVHCADEQNASGGENDSEERQVLGKRAAKRRLWRATTGNAATTVPSVPLLLAAAVLSDMQNCLRSMSLALARSWSAFWPAQARRELRKREPPTGGERDCRSRRGRSMAIVVNSLLSEPRAKLLMEALCNNAIMWSSRAFNIQCDGTRRSEKRDPPVTSHSSAMLLKTSWNSRFTNDRAKRSACWRCPGAGGIEASDRSHHLGTTFFDRGFPKMSCSTRPDIV